MNKIFISYSSKDQEWVRNWLLLQLESNSLHAHIDFRDFEIGQPSLVNMERAVEECAKTLLVLTPNYVQSEVTNFEALFLVDYHLEVVFGTTCRRENTRRRDVPPGRLYRCHFQPVVSTPDLLSDARQHLAVAKEMIEQMGYGRRKSEVEALQRDLAIVK